MTATFYVGDAIETMNKLPENSVDLILTSPPFLALRSYLPADHPDKALEGGSQATPGAFIDWLIDVVEACDRVLASHGSLCIELGDTYAGATGFQGTDDFAVSKGRQYWITDSGTGPMREKKGSAWPLAKSLSLIPELFRLTLVYGTNPLTGRQTERWRLRNVVRWVRPNPPVGALGDKFRPATSELMVFCKSAKRYFDLDAVRADPTERDSIRPANWNLKRAEVAKEQDAMTQKGRRWPGDTEGTVWVNTAATTYEYEKRGGAPPLDWWNIPPGGFSGAHYAVWPPELLIKPIKAMCPSRVCRVCGEPSRRIVEATADYAAFRALRNAEYAVGDNSKLGVREASGSPGAWDNKTQNINGASYETVGFSDCGHDDWRPGLVLDPFGGSGTTALVATGHGRDCILIDLDERNYDLALERVGPFILSRAESV